MYVLVFTVIIRYFLEPTVTFLSIAGFLWKAHLNPYIPPTFQSTNGLQKMFQFGYSSLPLKFIMSKINLRFLPNRIPSEPCFFGIS